MTDHDKRVYHHMYETNEGIAEHAERIAKLEELLRDVYALHWSGLNCTECPWIGECDTDGGCPWLGIMHDHMRALGLVVE